jgi:hypothetical protein
MEVIIRYVCLLRSVQSNCGGAGGSGFSCEPISGKENQIVTYRKKGNYSRSQSSFSADFTEKDATSVNVSDFYSVYLQFESWPGHRIS